ncbi:protein GVQW3-like [Stegodyphus dumicola]|uniref:protein GVQW3-like n=1 Tax=Stegodyphus dumicola TaxID=202533 RepID=UPI0015B1DCEA|nr:protein GVQW3-like [Stegodyphus dumicola]
MEQYLEQRYAIKFCVRLNKTTTHTLGIIQEAFKEEAMSRAMVFTWQKRFKGCRGNVEDDDRSGRPSSNRTNQNVKRVRELLNKVCAKLVPKVLSVDQKKRLMTSPANVPTVEC